jgi:sRNA-binding carbon storage regulator CsrA
MLVVGVRVGREVIVGDHTVVTVSSIDRANQEVKLGFDSEYMVNRVNDSETTIKAAKIRARAKRGMAKRNRPMEKMKVYVGSYVSEGEPKMKAALTKSAASFPGARLSTISDETSMSLASHQFLVVRSGTEAVASALGDFTTKAVDWPVLDQIEAGDSTIYTLMVRTTAEKTEGDVAYIDLMKP